MASGFTWATKEEKNSPETPERGQFIRSTLLDMDSRLRVASAIEKDETQASIGVFQVLKRRGHPDGPPPTISDGWGGIDKAMIEVYGLIPEYGGRGRPPTRKKPGKGWLYLQMVKQRDDHGHFVGSKLKAIFGSLEALTPLLGEVTAYIERSHLTSRLLNSRQTRKNLAFSKNLACCRAAATWEDAYYDLVRPHKSLRQPVSDFPGHKWIPRTPAMAAALTDHIWSVKELLMTIPLKR